MKSFNVSSLPYLIFTRAKYVRPFALLEAYCWLNKSRRVSNPSIILGSREWNQSKASPFRDKEKTRHQTRSFDEQTTITSTKDRRCFSGSVVPLYFSTWTVQTLSTLCYCVGITVCCINTSLCPSPHSTFKAATSALNSCICLYIS